MSTMGLQCPTYFLDDTVTDIIAVSWDNLIGEDAYILVEWLGRTDVATSDARFSRRARRQLALLKDERQQREQRVPANTTKQRRSSS